MKDIFRKLLCDTTIISIFNAQTNTLIVGNSNEVSRFETDPGEQVKLEDLEKNWQKKFNSFSNTWGKDRQLFRFFYDQFRLFYRSFTQLRINKITYSESKNLQKDYCVHEFSATNLASMYLFGKKMIGLVKELKLDQKLDKNDKSFIERFTGTRNLLFEHNFHPKHYPNILFDPNFWSITASDSFLEIDIHAQKESEYYARIDYYQDYYDLEAIMKKLIDNF